MIVLFSHHQFARALATRWIGRPVKERRRLSLGVASLGRLGYDPSHPEIRVIAPWNANPSSMALPVFG